ncbi:MAG TPA: class I SAM-dependent methyltransferase [Casimicrobiaceae bacterium]
MTTFDDAFYRDILEGLAVYCDSAFQRDILATISRHQEPRIAVALNKNQMASKVWLAESLLAAAGPRLGRVLILGGWVGALAAVLLHDRRFVVERVDSIDIDPRCAPIAESLNATHVHSGRFGARTADMVDLDYVREFGGEGADLVINTSCEHLADFDRWYARIPAGQLLVMQSNDYFACAEHVNCVPDLAAFRRQATLAEVLFAGERRMRRYVRFMLIGRK